MVKTRQKIKSIIFGTDTQTGKLFDEVLIVAIILSIITVLLDSVSKYNQDYGNYLYIAEWVFTCLLYTSPSPRDGLLSRMPSSA